MVAVFFFGPKTALILDRRKARTSQTGDGMVNRMATAQTTWRRAVGPPAIVMLAANGRALTALNADAAARQARRRHHRGDGAARRRRTDHGDRVDQDAAGHFLRRRRLDPARAV